MPTLTRRRSEHRQQCWHIYYGDIHVGRLPSASAIRMTPIRGNGTAVSIRALIRASISLTAATFEEARADFERAWLVFLSKRTDADFQKWRDERDWTERKYALWDAGKRLEPPSYGPGKPCSRFMKCPCGEVYDMHGPNEVLTHVPHITRPISGGL
jgi:hypothetical protein